MMRYQGCRRRALRFDVNGLSRRRNDGLWMSRGKKCLGEPSVVVQKRWEQARIFLRRRRPGGTLVGIYLS